MTDDIMELGGNITLIGFKDLEPAQLVVVKKMIGNYVKKMQEKKEISKITITLKNKEENFLEVVLKTKDEENKVEDKDSNLFFCVNKILSKFL